MVPTIVVVVVAVVVGQVGHVLCCVIFSPRRVWPAARGPNRRRPAVGQGTIVGGQISGHVSTSGVVR